MPSTTSPADIPTRNCIWSWLLYLLISLNVKVMDEKNRFDWFNCTTIGKVKPWQKNFKPNFLRESIEELKLQRNAIQPVISIFLDIIMIEEPSLENINLPKWLIIVQCVFSEEWSPHQTASKCVVNRKVWNSKSVIQRRRLTQHTSHLYWLRHS